MRPPDNHVDKVLREISSGSSDRTVSSFAEQSVRIYDLLGAFGSFRLDTREDYIERYRREFCLIDMAYRRALCDFREISPDHQLYDALLRAKRQLDGDYGAAVDRLNREWLESVRREGMRLDDISGILRQQNIYSVHLASSPVRTAFVISDALRYEVALQLMRQMGESSCSLAMDAALAMLPSLTKYCKDSLLPHRHLTLEGDTMLVDGGLLASNRDRNRQLAAYNPDSRYLTFEEVVRAAADKEDEPLSGSLVYIYHNRIDSIGHDSPGDTPQACDIAVGELRELIGLLHSRFGFGRVILTADHGFLYGDTGFEESARLPVPEESPEIRTRFYLTHNPNPTASASVAVTKLPLGNVSDIESGHPLFVAVPEGDNRFIASAGGYAFAHGGVSLQELVVPLLFSSAPIK